MKLTKCKYYTYEIKFGLRRSQYFKGGPNTVQFGLGIGILLDPNTYILGDRTLIDGCAVLRILNSLIHHMQRIVLMHQNHGRHGVEC